MGKLKRFKPSDFTRRDGRWKSLPTDQPGQTEVQDVGIADQGQGSKIAHVNNVSEKIGVCELTGDVSEVSSGPFPEVVPAQLAGKWIVWSIDQFRIVGSGDTAKEAEQNATEPFEFHQKVPALKKWS
jgi:hypothetical protein